VPTVATGPITVVLGGFPTAPRETENIATDLTTGDVFVVNSLANTVKVYNSRGEFKFQFGSTGSGPGQFGNPTGIAIDANGEILVCDTGNSRIEVFDNKGRFKFQFSR